MYTMLIAAILFGVMAFLVKILSHTISPEEIVFFRFFLGALSILFFVIIRFAKLRFNNKRLLVFRGIIGSVAIVFFFKAIKLIPVSDAVVLQFSYPIFATVFAAIFLDEKLKLSSVIAMFVAFVGIVFISSPVFIQFNIGYVHGIAAAVFAGAAIVATRRLRRTENAWSITFSLMFFGTIVGFIVSMGKIAIPSPNGFFLLMGMVAVATVAQLLLNYSYKYCDVAHGTIISMLTVPVTVLLAVIFLDEYITINFAIGSVLILGSIFYIFKKTA
ncbi:MAG: DMT family transporter [Candidatus Saganbacteria bacterium]|nr:DMT family transporter [Candidatus Saganbacteria bacterium]